MGLVGKFEGLRTGKSGGVIDFGLERPVFRGKRSHVAVGIGEVFLD